MFSFARPKRCKAKAPSNSNKPLPMLLTTAIESTDSKLPQTSLTELDIGEELGRGGLAIVYRCIWKGKDSALKLRWEREGLLAEQAESDRSALVKEAQLLQGLKFDGIVEVFAHVFSAGKLEGVLLECLGQTLLIRSTAPDFGARELYNALLDTCHAIRVINTKLIAHQDITAKNIAKGTGVSTYKVFDLDAAIQLESSEQLTRQWPGTFHIMSPEARSSAYSPIANDAWAIGATFGEQASALARKNWEDLDTLEDAPDLANCVMVCKKLLQPAEQRPRMDSAPACFKQLLATISVGSPAHFIKALVTKMDSELC